MRSTQFCSIEWLEHMVRVAKNSNYTHFRIVPSGSFAGFQFASSGRGYYVPSVEDRSITRDDCVRYLCAKITWDEYMEIRQKATEAFINGEYEEE
jgi:hypothetical protein